DEQQTFKKCGVVDIKGKFFPFLELLPLPLGLLHSSKICCIYQRNRDNIQKVRSCTKKRTPILPNVFDFRRNVVRVRRQIMIKGHQLDAHFYYLNYHFLFAFA
uniref:Uncharacterized protein n=1 Tax=Romanomermis culicivorax TaxID=13658 RepID=A0A915IBU1_ROMCU